MTSLTIEARREIWPLRDAFTIARGSKSEAHVVLAIVTDGTAVGRGECVPYARYGETVDDTIAAIESLSPLALNRSQLAHALPPGAARNAVDCALWDFEAKKSGVSVSQRAGLSNPLRPVLTAFTISLDAPDVMASKARSCAAMPLLKLKLGGDRDEERMRAVRAARPEARLIVDANESWIPGDLPNLLEVAADVGVEVVEQPLPERDDEALRGCERRVPVCADESCRDASSLPRLLGLYDAVNIKLDKAGGLTAALDLQRRARSAGLKIMVGSMVATSLAAAPALILAQDAEWTDLDGPLLLARDREPAIAIANGVMSPADPRLWG